MNLDDIQKIQNFLIHTPEERVRKVLLDQNFTPVDARLALKITRACSPEEFAVHFVQEDFPKIKLTAAETKLKESFWPRLKAVLVKAGLRVRDEEKQAPLVH